MPKLYIPRRSLLDFPVQSTNLQISKLRTKGIKMIGMHVCWNLQKPWDFGRGCRTAIFGVVIWRRKCDTSGKRQVDGGWL